MTLKMETECFFIKLVMITRLHRVPCQKAVIFIVCAVRNVSLTGLVIVASSQSVDLSKQE
jgi:hypothetical protein